LPKWEDVENRDYETWKTKHLTVDTAKMSVDKAVDNILEEIHKIIN